MMTASTPASIPVPEVTPDRLEASLAALAEIASTGGRVTAAGLLQRVLREFRAEA